MVCIPKQRLETSSASLTPVSRLPTGLFQVADRVLVQHWPHWVRVLKLKFIESFGESSDELCEWNGFSPRLLWVWSVFFDCVEYCRLSQPWSTNQQQYIILHLCFCCCCCHLPLEQLSANHLNTFACCGYILRLCNVAETVPVRKGGGVPNDLV